MANLVYHDDDKLLKKKYYYALSSTAASNPTHLPPSHTGIADSGASGIYFASNAPVANLNYSAPAVGVRVAMASPFPQWLVQRSPPLHHSLLRQCRGT